MAGQKMITPSDPDRADRRMISYLMRIHFKNKGLLSDEIYDRICKVFDKAGGSWVKVFQGSSEDLDTLKKIIKIGIKKGIIPKKNKKAALEKQAIAKGIKNFTEDMYVSIEKVSREHIVSLYDKKIERGMIIPRQETECGKAWDVAWVHADRGWGPFLYDLAMEVVGRDGLSPHRETIRPEARAIWKYYFQNRPDIIKVKKTKELDSCLSYHDEDSYLNYIYIKPRKTIIPWLKMNNKFIVR